MRRINLSSQLSKAETDALKGSHLAESHIDTLLTEDADVYTPEGDLLCIFRKSALDPGKTATAFSILRKLNSTTDNRGMATGKGLQRTSMKLDGTMSNTNAVPAKLSVKSSIIGYFDRYIRIPYCRQTAFTAQHPLEWDRLLPFLQNVSDKYRELSPDRFALQKEIVDKTSPDFMVPGTVFTTITVNKNWPTAVHTDKGDLKIGLSVILCFREGNFRGCHLVFPRYRVGVDLGTTDLLLFDSHHAHGNTPLIGKIRESTRVSLVLYYREKMMKCGSAAEEAERAKRRRKGDPLYES